MASNGNGFSYNKHLGHPFRAFICHYGFRVGGWGERILFILFTPFHLSFFELLYLRMFAFDLETVFVSSNVLFLCFAVIIRIFLFVGF